MSKTNKKLGVLFDLDGVLVDTGPYHLQAWYDLAQQQVLNMTDDLFHETFGMQNYQILPMMTERQLTADEIEEFSVWKEARYRQLIHGELELLPGVRGLINGLKEAGFLLAIGTSTPRVNLDFLLEHVPMADKFDALVSSEDVKHGKPAPDTFLKAAEKLSLPASNCAVVEDSIPGIASGKAGGMKVVAVTTTRKPEELTEADIIVDSLAELAASDFARLLQ